MPLLNDVVCHQNTMLASKKTSSSNATQFFWQLVYFSVDWIIQPSIDDNNLLLPVGMCPETEAFVRIFWTKDSKVKDTIVLWLHNAHTKLIWWCQVPKLKRSTTESLHICVANFTSKWLKPPEINNTILAGNQRLCLATITYNQSRNRTLANHVDISENPV